MGRGMGSGGGEKAKDLRKTIGTLIAYMKPYRPAIIIALMLVLCCE